MHFARSEEQQELAGLVRSLLAKRSDSAAVRAAVASPAGYDVALWQQLCDQVGVAALAVPEDHEGFGASLVETAIVLEELGVGLTPSPLLSSAIRTAAVLLHGAEDERTSLLPRIAAGEIVPMDLGAVVLEPEVREPSMDQTLRIGRGSTTPPDDVRAIAVALISALQVGTMQRALDMTVAYSQERVQFGRPIGSFQALKHRMADMLVLLEASRSASWAATATAAAYVADPARDDALERLQRSATVAGRYCTTALATIAGETIQLHGGIAITWEHDAHLVFKRAHALAHLVEWPPPAR